MDVRSIGTSSRAWLVGAALALGVAAPGIAQAAPLAPASALTEPGQPGIVLAQYGHGHRGHHDGYGGHRHGWGGGHRGFGYGGHRHGWGGHDRGWGHRHGGGHRGWDHGGYGHRHGGHRGFYGGY